MMCLKKVASKNTTSESVGAYTKKAKQQIPTTSPPCRQLERWPPMGLARRPMRRCPLYQSLSGDRMQNSEPSLIGSVSERSVFFAKDENALTQGLYIINKDFAGLPVIG